MDKNEKSFLKNVEERDMNFLSVLRLYQQLYVDAPVATERNIMAYSLRRLFRRLCDLGITDNILQEMECENYVEGT